jgi:hypothetical protein
MELPDTPQDVTPDLLPELELKDLLDLYAKASAQSWATVKEAIRAEIERRIGEERPESDTQPDG